MYKLGLYKFNFDLYSISLHNQNQKIKIMVKIITYLFDLLYFVSNFNFHYRFQLRLIVINFHSVFRNISPIIDYDYVNMKNGL